MMRTISLAIFLVLRVILIGQTDYTIQSPYQEQAKTLMNHPKIQKGFAHIINLEAETQADHIALTEIPAPPFMEDERGLAFQKRLEEIGVDTSWIDEVGNVLALLKGTKRKRLVALDAHLDTVFPAGTDVTVKIKNDTLYAPGIGDDTRGLAIVLAVVKALHHAEIQLEDDLLIVGTVGEEGLGDLRGVKHLFRAGGLGIDSWISVDGGDLGRIYSKALGSYRYKVMFHGPGGHSWGAFGLANPHHALGDAINRFVDRADRYTSTGPSTSYNVGVIGGGTSVNSIPYESHMLIDIRSTEPSRLDTMQQLLQLSVEEATANQNKRKRLGAELTHTIEKIGDRPSGEMSSDAPLVQRTLACTAAIGKRPLLIRGSTNANTPISMGIPAVTIGRGGVGANAHALDEWWLNKEGYRAIQQTFLLLVAEAGLVK